MPPRDEPAPDTSGAPAAEREADANPDETPAAHRDPSYGMPGDNPLAAEDDDD